MAARLLEKYKSEIKPVLESEFPQNKMLTASLEKVTISVGTGFAMKDSKLMQNINDTISLIAGQKAVTVISKKSIAGFKVREEMPVGVKVNLRGERMYEFIDKLCSIALPRVKDFRGLERNGFDGAGNFNFGLDEQLMFPEVEFDNVIQTHGMNIAITTSTDKEDKILEKYCNKHSIKFFQGSKDNVIKRYIDAAKKFKVNTIIRITGDCPEISNEITNILLNKHLKTNSDYTVAKNSPIGFSGEILNLSSLKKIIKKKPRAYLSEYMTYYFTNNSKIFKLNFVNLPKYMQKKYRMTIDYKKDLIFFKELYKCFEKEKIEFNSKNLNLIINKYKYLNNINSNLKLTYKTDKKLIDKINKDTIIFEK